MLKRVCLLLLLVGSLVLPFYIFPLKTKLLTNDKLLEQELVPVTEDDLDWLLSDETLSISSVEVECDCDLCKQIDFVQNEKFNY